MKNLLHPLSRRNFLTAAGVTSATAGLNGCSLLKTKDTQLSEITRRSNEAWAFAHQIGRETQVPKFPKRDFLVTDFGAKSDGSDNSQVFAKVIATCNESGGGRVVIPKGEFLTGPIHLLSNVNLHLEQGCTLLFSTNPKDYLPAVFTRWEGMELMGYSPLVYAYQQTNIALTGKGTLDGQADENTWWPWKGGTQQSDKNWSKDGVPTQDAARKKLARDVEINRPVSERVYAEGAQLRPPFVQFYSCNICLIEDVTITRAPFWLINPVLSQHVTVRGVTCASLGPNS
ncbi:MAG: twin-arginine translocation signal domain-containing protein, partial [Moraxellaceae bacterium]